jgi:Leucine Rich repeats (2 copies)
MALWVLIICLLIFAGLVSTAMAMGLIRLNLDFADPPNRETSGITSTTVGTVVVPNPTTMAPTTTTTMLMSTYPSTAPSRHAQTAENTNTNTAPPYLTITPGSYTTPPTFSSISSTPSIAPSLHTSDRPSNPPTDIFSDLPSDVPSIVPSTVPSMAPTTLPTSPPSSSPSLRSRIPTYLPTTTDSPTTPEILSFADRRTTVAAVLQYRGASPDHFYDPSTPQGQAFLWMIAEDSITYEVLMASQIDMTDDTIRQICQRFAIVTLDLALHNNDTHKQHPQGVQEFTDDLIWWDFPSLHDTWTSPIQEECQWKGILCSDDGAIVSINWSRQQLSGNMPPELALLGSSLKNLDLAQNNISGTVDVFWQLTNLEQLYLFDNQFTGTLSSQIIALPNLERLFLGQNKMTGRIPKEMVQNTMTGLRK